MVPALFGLCSGRATSRRDRRPLSAGLVKKMVKARVAQNEMRKTN